MSLYDVIDTERRTFLRFKPFFNSHEDLLDFICQVDPWECG